MPVGEEFFAGGVDEGGEDGVVQPGVGAAEGGGTEDVISGLVTGGGLIEDVGPPCGYASAEELEGGGGGVAGGGGEGGGGGGGGCLGCGGGLWCAGRLLGGALGEMGGREGKEIISSLRHDNREGINEKGSSNRAVDVQPPSCPPSPESPPPKCLAFHHPPPPTTRTLVAAAPALDASVAAAFSLSHF